MMRYVKLWADTDFCGTYDCAAFAYEEENFCENLLDLDAELFGETVFGGFAYLALEEINEADYETEEEYHEALDEAAEDYMSHCYCGGEEITYEEFVELGGTLMKDRGVACKNYICEGECKKGREGTMFHYCQKCSIYDPIPGGKNAKPNRKREKTDKFMKDKRNW